MCIYLPRLHICSSFPWSSPDFWILLVCEIREKRATCGINQLDGKWYIFYSCPYPFPFKDMFPGLSMCCLQWHIIMWPANIARLHQLRVPVAALTSPRLWQPKMSSDIARCPHRQNCPQLRNTIFFFFFFFFGRYKWHITLYHFQVYNIMIQYLYILWNYHHSKSS